MCYVMLCYITLCCRRGSERQRQRGPKTVIIFRRHGYDDVNVFVRLADSMRFVNILKLSRLDSIRCVSCIFRFAPFFTSVDSTRFVFFRLDSYPFLRRLWVWTSPVAPRLRRPSVPARALRGLRAPNVFEGDRLAYRRTPAVHTPSPSSGISMYIYIYIYIHIYYTYTYVVCVCIYIYIYTYVYI